jgi:molecular chaperone GrpE
MSKDENKWKDFSDEQVEPESAEEGVEASTESAPDAEADASQEQPVEGGLELPSRQQLEDQLTAMEQKVSEYKDQSVRSVAELENVRRRAERDVQNAHKFGTERLTADLLPVVDSLVRGLETLSDQSESVREGMSLTLELLHKTLNKNGVETIDPAAGELFNPEVHEAMSMIPQPGAEKNTIIEVMQEGYLLNGRVLRAAMVIVAQ